MIDKFIFRPSEVATVDGTALDNEGAFPDPVSATETREQFSRLHYQTRDYINNIILPAIDAVTDTANDSATKQQLKSQDTELRTYVDDKVGGVADDKITIEWINNNLI